jgi:DNA-binding transcriptional LysR family regulator
VLPRLPDFLAEYPEIELYMSEGDRLVDLVREGIDCVLRVGDLQDSDMVARRVTMLTEMTCAAPAYIDRFGMPASVDVLDGHRMVGFRSSATGALLPLEFVRDSVVRHVDLPATVAVNGAESLVAAGRLGLGLIQVPRYHIESDLAQGTLVAVLPDFRRRRRRFRCSIPAIGSFHHASACSSTGSSGCLPAAKADAPGPQDRRPGRSANRRFPAIRDHRDE